MNLNQIPRQIRRRPLVGALGATAVVAAIGVSSLAVAGIGNADDERLALTAQTQTTTVETAPPRPNPAAPAAPTGADETQPDKPSSDHSRAGGDTPDTETTPAPTDTDDQAEPATATVVAAADAPLGPTSTESAPDPDAPAPTEADVADVAAPVPPTPEELEGPVGDGAGEISVVDGGAQPAQDPTPAPGWTEVALSPVEDAAPTGAAPLPEVQVPPVASGPPGQLVGNATGCQLQCISTATLAQPGVGTSLMFDLTTKVETAAAAWLLDSPPAMIGGVPSVGAWPHAISGAYGTSWDTSFAVQPDTTYHFVLRVEDVDGHARWATTSYTTAAAAPDQLTGNGDGCYYQCITTGILYPTDSYERVDLVIGASVGPAEDVAFEVFVSTSEPGWIGPEPAVPFLPEDFPFVLDQDGGNDIRGHVSGLAADTDYHVVIKATDEDGHTAHAVGQFRTDPEPEPIPLDVKVGWERIYVHHDGDKGAWGRGELAFAWGLQRSWGNDEFTGLTSFGWTNEDKIGDDTSVPLGGYSHTWIEVFEGDTLPIISVTAHENDTHGNIEYDHCRDARQVTHQAQHYDSTCTTRINVAVEHDLTLDEIRALQSCADLGIPDKADHFCLVTKSQHANDQHATFDAVLSFLIVE